jgi:hypothetical protein
VQAGGGSILLWGVFTCPLVRLNTSPTGDHYEPLLGDRLQPIMYFMYSHNEGIFQQDNASCHRGQVVQNWFEEHSGEF